MATTLDFSYNEITLTNTVPGASKSAMRMGGSFVEAKAQVTAMVVDANHDLIVAFTFTGTVAFGGGSTATNPSTGSYGICIVKYSSAGAVRWVLNLANGYNSQVNGVSVDANGDVLIVGTYQGTIKFDGTTPTTSLGGFDAFAAKYSGSTGSYIWSKSFGNTTDHPAMGITSDQSANSVCVDANDGNPVVLGSFITGISVGSTSLVSNGYYDVFLTKLSASTGVPIWAVAFGGSGDDRGISVLSKPGGGVITVGYFTGTVNFLGTSKTSAGVQDLYLASITSNGTLTSVQTHGKTGTPSTIYPQMAAINSAGQIGIVGLYANGIINLGGSDLPSTTTPGMFMARYAADLSHVWSKSFGGTGQSADSCNGCAVDSSGNLYATGVVRNAIDFGGGYLFAVPITVDPFVAKFEASDGHYLWANRYASTGSDFDSSNSIVLDESSVTAIAGGYFTGQINFGANVGLISILPGGSTDAFVVKISS